MFCFNSCRFLFFRDFVLGVTVREIVPVIGIPLPFIRFGGALLSIFKRFVPDCSAEYGDTFPVVGKRNVASGGRNRSHRCSDRAYRKCAPGICEESLRTSLISERMVVIH